MQLLEIITLTTTISKCSLASALVTFHSNETPHYSESVHGVGGFYQTDRNCAPLSASPSIVELQSTSPTPVPSHPFDTSSPTLLWTTAPSSAITAEPSVAQTFPPTIANSNVPNIFLSSEPTEIAATMEPSIAQSSSAPDVVLSLEPFGTDCVLRILYQQRATKVAALSLRGAYNLCQISCDEMNCSCCI